MTATPKMTLVHHKAGQVLGALTRVAAGAPPAPADVAPDGFVLHSDTDFTKTFAIPAADILTTEVNLEPNLFFAPQQWAVVDDAAAFVPAAPLATVTPTAAPGTLGVSANGTPASGPKAGESVSVVVESAALGIHESAEAKAVDVGGGNSKATVQFSVPAGTYEIVVFVPGYQPIFTSQAV